MFELNFKTLNFLFNLTLKRDTRLDEDGFVSLFFYLYLCSSGIDDIGLIAFVIDFGMKQRVLVSVLFDGESPCPACC